MLYFEHSYLRKAGSYLTVGIGGSRGGMLGTRPLYGTQFFYFRMHFHQKVPALEVHAPPNGCTPP